MQVFLDTNVLVAASVRQHPHFARADAVLRRFADREDEGVIHSEPWLYPRWSIALSHPDFGGASANPMPTSNAILQKISC